MTPASVAIFGATSAIAEATARIYASRRAELFLVARDAARLEIVAADLRSRGAGSVATAVMDANDFACHEAVIAQAQEALGSLELVLIAHGTLPDQRACEASFELTRAELDTNCLSVLSLLTHLAIRMERQGRGTLAVISSVAGDRGRQSNTVYGTAKGAVSIFLQGLRGRMARSGVKVLTIKPGWVDTPMTAAFSKGPLWASPQQVAQGIARAVENKRSVVYLPWFWRPIMLVIRAIPERLFTRLPL